MSSRSVRSFRASLTLAAALVPSCGRPASAPPDRAASTTVVAFVDVNVVPMDRDVVLRGQTVMVRDGMIAAVGPRGEVPVPAGAEVIAGEGGYLLPGLADMHVHLYDAQGFPSYLACGFTTLADLNGSPDVLAWRDAVARRALRGPTLYTTGPSLNGYPPGNPQFVALEDPQAARRVVAAQRSAGYDLIKVYNTLPEPVYEAILTEAAAERRPVIGHVPWDVGVERALAGYQSNVAHMEELASYFDAEPSPSSIAALTRAVVASGDYVTPNLFTYADYLRSVEDLDATLRDPALRNASPAALSEKLPLNNRSIRPDPAGFAARLREGQALFRTLTRAFSDAGVPLLLGTDTEIFGLAGLSGLSELELLVDAGLTPYQALVTATRRPGEFVAAHVHPGERFGTVTPGSRADLVLVSQNPLDGVATLRAPRGVSLRGQWLTAAELTRARESAARANEPLQRAVRAIEADVHDARYAEAAVQLKEAMRTSPGVRVVAMVVLFDYAERASKASAHDALPFLEAAVALYPWSPAAVMKLGLALAEIGDDAGALARFEQARAMSPDDARVAHYFEQRAMRATPPTFDPVGTYAFTSWVGTGAHRKEVSGTFRIVKAARGYSGVLATSLGPEMPMDEVIAGGDRLWMHARAHEPDVDAIELAVQVEGTTARGRFIAGFGNNRPLTGRRVTTR